MLGLTVSIYLINKVYEDPVFYCLQSYHKNCLVSSYQSKAQWTLSLQSCITEKKKFVMFIINVLTLKVTSVLELSDPSCQILSWFP